MFARALRAAPRGSTKPPRGRGNVTAPPGDFAWQFTDDSTLYTGANTTTALATNVPSGAVYSSSPDLLPGQTLSLSGTTLNLVGDSTVPTVNDATSGSAIDTISARDVHIEVMDSPIATIYNRTQVTTFGKTHNGTTWFSCIDAANDGDVIEISPGAINETNADCTNYFNGLDNSGMVVVKGVTIRNIPGRGRWRLFPAGVTPAATRSGITIFGPTSLNGYAAPYRKTIVIEGFDITDQFGTERDAYGCRVRSDKSGSDPTGAWTDHHISVTFRNFKVGKTSGITGSGFSGTAETLVFEDGDCFDCGQSGLEHNFYVSARNLTARGVRSRRTRGGGSLDGHIFKTRSLNSLFKGCVFEGYGTADNTDVIHLANGGAHVITGCLFIQGASPSANNGIIVYENEQSGNEPWWYGDDGHSVAVRRNVFISRAAEQYGWGCPFITTRHPDAANYVSGASFAIEDNIGANANLASTYWIAQTLLSGSGFTSAGTWTTSNSVETYDASDTAFNDTLLKLYTRAAGTVAATGAAVTTDRFTWPHGYIARSDSYRGLA